MKHSHYIHLVLLLAMLVGQLSTNAHVVNHLHEAASVTNHLDHGAAGHQHHRHDIDAEYTNTLENCAIYHAYAGMSGLSTAVCNSVVQHLNHSPTAIPLNVALITQSIAAQPIRGPPLKT